MAGVLFIICIPTGEEENKIISNGSSRRATPAGDGQFVSTPTRAEDFQFGTFSEKGMRIRHAKSTDNIVLDVDHSDSTTTVPLAPPSETATNLTESPILKKSNTETNLKSMTRSSFNADEGDGLRKSWDGLRQMVNSAKRLKPPRSSPVRQPSKKDTEKELSIPSDSCMVDVIKEMQLVMRIENAVWTEGNSHKKWQIIFSVEAGPRSDNIVRILDEWGIGDRAGSFVSILPCTLYKNANENSSETDEKNANDFEHKESGWHRFLSSMTARLNVAQIVEEVRGSAEITFDFISLLIVASLVATFGLVENNSLFLAASMLISPLMGPIIAATFGTVIKDRKLQLFGVVNELLGIALVTLVGFICGLIVCIVDEKFSSGTGLTNEMINRSLLRSVIIGIFVAIPSGVAAAIGILGDNFGSLAGVAISASLLPPAVNTGLMFSFAVIYKVFEFDDDRFNTLINSNKYSDHQSIELAVMGGISMCVTLTNVICIYLMGVIFLKIKEVAPSLPHNHRQFWKHDIKIARDYNKNHVEDNDSLRRTLEDEIAGYETKNQGIRAEIVRRLARPFSSHQNTWSPTSAYLTYQNRDQNRKPLQEVFEQVNFNHLPYSNGQTTHHNPLSTIYFNQFSQNRLNDFFYHSAAVPSTVKPIRGKAFNALNMIQEQVNLSRSSVGTLSQNSALNTSSESTRNAAKRQKSKPRKFLVIPVNDQNGDNSKA